MEENERGLGLGAAREPSRESRKTDRENRGPPGRGPRNSARRQYFENAEGCQGRRQSRQGLAGHGEAVCLWGFRTRKTPQPQAGHTSWRAENRIQIVGGSDQSPKTLVQESCGQKGHTGPGRRSIADGKAGRESH